MAITLLTILHAIPEADDPHAIVAKLLDAVPSGSYIAISRVGSDFFSPETLRGLEDIGDRMSQQKITYRTREQVARFFEGTDLVDPGLVRIEEWRPATGAPGTAKSSLWGGVGRKR